MSYKDEKAMYPDVAAWLKQKLKEKYRNKAIETYDTHAKYLNKFLISEGLHTFCSDFQSYEIKVDVTGTVIWDDKLDLVFVECKLLPITLRDISQLLGYSRVAIPIHSILLSPEGLSSSVAYLFNTLKRYDVLKYDDRKNIMIGKWKETSKDLDPTSIIPKGVFL
jgi:predicted Rdx family selenoprotein